MKKHLILMPLAILLLHGIFYGQQILPVDKGGDDLIYDDEIRPTFIRGINTDLAVGKILGQHDVSATGGALYNIPISLPPGTNAIMPQLNLSYNSQGGDSPLGLGWNISGSSAITRVRKDHVHDNNVTPVSWNNDCPIALDGMRLQLLSGTHLQSGAVYGKEIEDFSKIYIHDYEGEIYFEVWTKDGLIYQYGKTNNGKIYGQNGTIFSWRLNRVYDLNGNYYAVRYDDTTGESVLSSIEYTGNDNAGLAPYWRVSFEYNNRMDDNEVWVMGKSFKKKALLRRIIISRISDGSIAGKYFLNYATKDNHSVLREVTQVGKNGGTLNSTIVKYGNNGTPYTESLSNNDDNGSDVWINGDFDGDGLTDVIKFEANGSVNGIIPLYDTYTFMLKGVHNTSTFSAQSSHTLSPAITVNASNNLIESRAFDYNGDGIDDVVTLDVSYNNIGNLSYYVLNKINIYQSPHINGTLGNLVTYTPPSPYNQVYHSNLNTCFIPGDFDGDSRMDFISVLTNGGSYKEILTTANGSNTYHILNTASSDWYKTENRIQIIDFDGDGTSEILFTDGISNPQQSKIYSFEKQTGPNLVKTQVYSAGYPTMYHEIFPGDFNGDGMTDLLTFNGTNWRVGYSTGQVFHEVNFNIPQFFNSGKELRNIIPGDYNGDGYTDILQLSKIFPTSSTSYVTLLESNGNTFAATVAMQPVSYNIHQLSQPLLGDYNGDGSLDLLYRRWNSLNLIAPTILLQFEPNVDNRLAIEIGDGFGYNVQFTYKSLAQDDNNGGEDVYNHATNNSFPFSVNQVPIKVVRRKTTPDGVGAINTSSDDIVIEYKYEDCTFHRLGRGLLGFKKITSKNLSFNTGIISEQINELEQNIGLLKAAASIIKLNSQDINNTYTYGNYNSISNNRYWYQLNSIVEKDHINQSKSTQEFYDYDNFGNPQSIDQYIGAPINGSFWNAQEVKSNKFKFQSFHGFCNPGKLIEQTEQNTRSSQPTVSKTTRNIFVNNGHRLQETIEWYGKPKAVSTKLSNYNTFGQARTFVTTAYGILTTTNKVNYDSKGRFVIEKINALNQSSYTSYDEFSGKLLSEITVSGLTSSNTYDEFYRLTTHTNHIGLTTAIDYSWDLQSGSGTNPTAVQNSWYHTTKTTPGSAPIVVQYDLLGRELNTQTIGFNGQQLSKITTYYPFGGLRSSTSTFDPNNSTQAVITLHAYDPNLNFRVGTDIYGNTVNSISYSYDNTLGNTQTPLYQTVTVTSPLGTNWKMTDMTGKVIQSHDDGGTLSFTYDSWGNNLIVNDGTINLSNSSFDDYGRQKTLQPNGTGITKYEYDALGRLYKQTDPANNTQTNVFDVLGRISTQSGPEGTTTYSYVTSGNGLNKLKTITGFNGIQKNYDYDSFDRLMYEESLMGFPISKTYYYNNHGRLQYEEYSTGFGIQHQYNTYGYEFITSYDDGSGTLTPLMAASSANNLGQFDNFTLGNNATSSIQYNEYGMPEIYDTPGIQYLQLNWDVSTSNLDSRFDNISSGGLTESFNYDNLQRLVGSQVTSYGVGSPALNAPLNNYGDYLSKHDAGTEYEYYGQHQVRKVKNDASNIPLPTQTVTFNSFNEPELITEDNTEIEFVYGPEKMRMQSKIKDASSGLVTELRHYVHEMGYEVVKKNGTIHHLHYIPLAGNTMGIVRIAESVEGGTFEEPELLYVYKDHIGSWLTVTDGSGAIVAEQNFDAWGRKRNVNDWSYVNIASTPDWLIRGFTGHEHFDEVGIIHMNGRLYDPLLGTMFSPDNHVQNPYSTQAFNRYAYAYNNPLKYTDPSGEFVVVDSWLVGFIDGFFSTSNGRLNAGWNEANHRAGMDARIWRGLFVTDNNRNFWGRSWELMSRFTWQAPQTVIGWFHNQSANTIYGRVNSVEYFGGATIVDVNDLLWDFDMASGVTFGNYIQGEGISSDPNESGNFRGTGVSRGAWLLRHEYGHYRQSQRNGPLYLIKYGIPSAAGADWTENDAEFRSDEYFLSNNGLDPIFEESYPEDYEPINAKWWEFTLIGLGPTGAAVVVSLNINRGK